MSKIIIKGCLFCSDRKHQIFEWEFWACVEQTPAYNIAVSLKAIRSCVKWKNISFKTNTFREWWRRSWENVINT